MSEIDFQLADDIHAMLKTPLDTVRKQYMDKFALLEAQPHTHIPKVIATLCAPNEFFV
jgi:hypothetical protein